MKLLLEKKLEAREKEVKRLKEENAKLNLLLDDYTRQIGEYEEKKEYIEETIVELEGALASARAAEQIAKEKIKELKQLRKEMKK